MTTNTLLLLIFGSCFALFYLGLLTVCVVYYQDVNKRRQQRKAAQRDYKAQGRLKAAVRNLVKDLPYK